MYIINNTTHENIIATNKQMLRKEFINFLLTYITDTSLMYEEKKQLAHRISEKVLKNYDNQNRSLKWKEFFSIQRGQKIQKFCDTYIHIYKMKLVKSHQKY